MKTHNLFISHSWTYNAEYDGLVSLLRSRPYFTFSNYSIPKDDPVHTSGSDKQLSDAIWRHLRPCGIVLVMAGVYSNYSKWIDKEIELAKKGFENPKPIVAVERWGSKRTSRIIKDAADRVVKWNADSIVAAIRDLA